MKKNYFKPKISIIFFVVLSISCANNTTQNQNIQKFTLKSTKIPMEIMGIFELAVVDTFLVARTKKDANAIDFYSANTYKYIGSVLKSGRGDNEFNNMETKWQVQRNSKGELQLWVFDSRLKKVSLLNVAKSLEKNTTVIDREFMYEFTPSLYNISYAGNNCIVGMSIEDKNAHINSYNLESKELKKLTSFYDDPVNTNMYEVYSSHTRIKPNNEMVVTALMYENKVILISLNDQKVESIYIGDEPISIHDVIKREPKDFTKYTSSLNVTDKHIWLMYADRTLLEISQKSENSVLIILDWEGVPVAHIELDKDLYSFRIDDINRKIYGITDSEDIFVYDMPEVL